MKKNPNKFIGAIKPTGKTKSSRAQNKARYTNVHNKAIVNSELGAKIRAMLYDMTKEKQYLEKNFQVMHKGNTKYSVSDIRSSLAFAKKQALTNAHKQHDRLQKIQKRNAKTTTYAEFRKANPQFTRSREDTKRARKKYNALVNKERKDKKLKKTSFKDFKKANPHLVNPLTGFDSADIEAFYDS